MRRFLAAMLVFAVGCDQNVSISKRDSDPIEPPPVADGIPQPDIEATPDDVQFSALPLDCEADRLTLNIGNVGEAVLNVSNIELRGQGQAMFGLHNLPSFPRRVGIGNSFDIEVGFRPQHFLTYDSARVEITSDDPDEPVLSVPLWGEGADDAIGEDLFQQGEEVPVDILIVMDNSCSMASLQGQMNAAMVSFANNLQQIGSDWRIAVTTTDTDGTGQAGAAPVRDGRFVGPWITPSTPNMVQVFTQQTVLGTSGSAREAGLEGAYFALTAPMYNSPPNAGFLREDANLAVVIISDEEDQSTENPSFYVNWLHSLKADPDMAAFHGVTGPRSCAGLVCGNPFQFNQVTTEPSPRYHNAFDATGGVWQDIRQINFPAFLQLLAYTSTGVFFQFDLSREPSSSNPSDFRVTVDGTDVPHDPINGFTVSGSTIVFHGDAIPESNAAIVVTYPYRTTCNN